MKAGVVWFYRFVVLLAVFLPLIARSNGALVDSLKVKNFVVKCSIILTNSKPSKGEITELCKRFELYDNFDSGSSRFLDSLIKSDAFSQNIFDRYRYEYLQGLTAYEITDLMFMYDGLLANRALIDYWDLFKSVKDKLTQLTLAEQDLTGGKISIAELQRRFFDNKFYDDNNMGAENFVVSSFNYLLFRNPTRSELSEGEKMINGEYGRLFLKMGKSKQEYLEILFSSPAYSEGQVRYWYNQLLNREPSASEIVADCSRYLDLKILIKEILMKKEFSR